jgi:uncharacterized membrane protein YcaP (DUF421 family)
MTTWLASGWAALGAVAAKGGLMYLTALVGLRLVHRRTLAQWTAIDFAAAVAVGAIIARTAVASTQSLLTGVVALATILFAHTVVTFARFRGWMLRVTDHRLRVLLENGRLRRRELWICGITESDLFAELRQRGVFELESLRYILYEPKGGLTVVREDGAPTQAEVLSEGLRRAVAWGPGEPAEQTTAASRGDGALPG